jgi:hypothetical protein
MLRIEFPRSPARTLGPSRRPPGGGSALRRTRRSGSGRAPRPLPPTGRSSPMCCARPVTAPPRQTVSKRCSRRCVKRYTPSPAIRYGRTVPPRSDASPEREIPPTSLRLCSVGQGPITATHTSVSRSLPKRLYIASSRAPRAPASHSTLICPCRPLRDPSKFPCASRLHPPAIPTLSGRSCATIRGGMRMASDATTMTDQARFIVSPLQELRRGASCPAARRLCRARELSTALRPS